MTATDARWHRTQRTNDAASGIACTIASALTAIAAYTRGATGPDTTLDQFRALQLDKTGGIDLYDAAYAARRLGVEFTVHANYDPGPEYPAGVAQSLRNGPAISANDVWDRLGANRFVVLQFRYSALPAALRHSSTFLSGHAGALLGRRVANGERELLVSDPLAGTAHWHPALPFWVAARAYSGSDDVYCADTPIRRNLYVARVRPLTFWHRYTHSAAGGWKRERRYTVTGWHAPCGAPQAFEVNGTPVVLVRILSGGFAGSFVAPAGYAVSVTEVA